MKEILRASELWVGVLGLASWLLARTNVMTEDDFQRVIVPIAVYVIGRLSKRAAKVVIK